MLADRAFPTVQLRGWREYLLLGKVLVVAPVVPALMRLPLPTVDRAMHRRRRTRLTDERATAVVEAAQRLAHPLVRRGCLTRGITLYWLLGDTRLWWFGLGGPGDGFCGHCWLERDGRPHLERLDPARFTKQIALPL